MMKIEDLVVYQLSMELGEVIWEMASKWRFFSRITIGKQIVRSADSVAANISEGHGRYHYKENRQFCYYSRGSLSETRTWLTKAHNRELVNDALFSKMIELVNEIEAKLNSYIYSIGKKAKH